MTISQSIYARRKGGMVFWRVGRVGGSFYLAKPASAEAKIAAKRARKARREAIRWEARMYRRLERRQAA